MQLKLDPKNIPSIPGARIVILQSKWYAEHLDKMVAKCLELLGKTGCEPVEHHILPGSLELPLAAQTMMRLGAKNNKPYDAVICFGAIMKGDTYHFEMIMDMCVRGFEQIMLAEDVPIIMEVLPVLNDKQLSDRSGDNEFNKGIEAALATAEIITWRRKIQKGVQ